eukprot:SAG31_NODE_14238_length_819_cov_1.050000_1_plen_194_part_10
MTGEEFHEVVKEVTSQAALFHSLAEETHRSAKNVLAKTLDVRDDAGKTDSNLAPDSDSETAGSESQPADVMPGSMTDAAGSCEPLSEAAEQGYELVAENKEQLQTRKVDSSSDEGDEDQTDSLSQEKKTLAMIRVAFDHIDGEADELINVRELDNSTIDEVLSTDARTSKFYETWKAGRIIIKFEHFVRMFIDV